MALSIEAMDPTKDYYKILKVSKKFSDRELKKSYRQLALQYHPDKAENTEEKEAATEKFVEVSEAYEVLSDPEKRKEYDDARRFGAGAGAGGRPGGGGASQQTRGAKESMASFTKMFESVFGHGFDANSFSGGATNFGADFTSGGASGGGRGMPKEFHFSGTDGFGYTRPPGDGFGGNTRLKRPTSLYESGSLITSLSKKKFPGTDANYEWLVQFYTIDAPSAEFRDSYRNIARDLKNKVRVGAVNCEKYAAFCTANGFETFPSFAYVWKGQLTKFKGQIDEYQVYNFAMEKHIERLQQMRASGEIEKLHAGNEAKLCNVGKQATSNASSLCAVFVLSGDKKKREKEMKVAKEVAAKFRHSKSLSIAYVDWKTQQRMVQKLMETAAGHSDRKQKPGLLIIRTKRGKLRVGMHSLDADFSADALSATMERAVGGDLLLTNFNDAVHFR